jgi:hypothetical protein
MEMNKKMGILLSCVDKMMHVLPLYDVAHHLDGMNLHIPAPESDVHTFIVIHEHNHFKKPGVKFVGSPNM